MTNPIIKIVNAETGEEIEREMNAQELLVYKADIKNESDRLTDAENKATAKAELLSRLGITAEEAALLLA